jgi:hypothetical protein
MKTINHNYNNSYTLPNESTIIRGTIYMTEDELQKAFIYLTKEYEKAKIKGNTAIRDGLSSLKNKKYTHQNINHFCLGITATQLLFKKHNLPRYKQQNYAIKIIK